MKRNREFLANCLKAMGDAPKGTPVTVAAAARIAAQTRQQGYYITFDYALRMLRFIKAHPQKARSIRKLGMWEELQGRVDALVARRGFKERDALAMVLCGPGPSQLYLAESSVVRLVHRARPPKSRPRRPLPSDSTTECV